jgi:glutamyl-tRNA(Gln) amidotransferase subunit E
VATIDSAAINLRVGFEIHQQLSTKSKLFCNCYCEETEKYGFTFVRKLRPTQSELGIYDPAALFEFAKMRTIKYHAAAGSSCLVEADEEPPHDVNKEAIETALIFSLALHSKIIDEVHVMRKIVIDGSNTSGFQRTMLVASGGYLNINNKKVGVQSICLEEDAAKLISDDGTIKEYGLDRLGVPLVEIALEPVTGKPEEIAEIALTLGRLLRASKKVARGLGSIRQDINISVENGAIVEVKGVQRLDQLVKVIEYEVLRQHGLILIAQKLKRDRKLEEIVIGDRIEDITDILFKSNSDVVKRSLADNNDSIFKAIRVKGFDGIIGFEPYPDIRIGKYLGELVRFYSLGGVFHSDELPNYGITKEEVEAIRKKLDLVVGIDAFVIVGGPKDKVEFALEAITERLKMTLIGVPAETRAATLEGKTSFSRPRSGAARMYPETDIPPIPINNSLLNSLSDKIPKSWDDNIKIIAEKYRMNKKIAEQIFDSNYFTTFEKIVGSVKIQPTFVASKLTEDIVNLERQGFDTMLLTEDIVMDVFKKLDVGIIAKESIILIFEKILRKEVKTVDEAITALGITSMTDQELNMAIDRILEQNRSIIREKGTGSIGMLMGRIMAILRGKVDGQKINSALRERLENMITNLTDRNNNGNA